MSSSVSTHHPRQQSLVFYRCSRTTRPLRAVPTLHPRSFPLFADETSAALAILLPCRSLHPSPSSLSTTSSLRYRHDQFLTAFVLTIPACSLIFSIAFLRSPHHPTTRSLLGLVIVNIIGGVVFGRPPPSPFFRAVSTSPPSRPSSATLLQHGPYLRPSFIILAVGQPHTPPHYSYSLWEQRPLIFVRD